MNPLSHSHCEEAPADVAILYSSYIKIATEAQRTQRKTLFISLCAQMNPLSHSHCEEAPADVAILYSSYIKIATEAQRTQSQAYVKNGDGGMERRSGG